MPLYLTTPHLEEAVPHAWGAARVVDGAGEEERAVASDDEAAVIVSDRVAFAGGKIRVV